MKPPMHALHALSQNAPARQKEGAQKRCATEGGRVPKTEGDASPRGETKNYNAGRKRRGRRPATSPEHRRGGCIRVCGAVGAEPSLASPEWRAEGLPCVPVGGTRNTRGGTRGRGPRQGAKSAYKVPSGGGPGTLGHSPSAVGHGPWLMAISNVEPSS